MQYGRSRYLQRWLKRVPSCAFRIRSSVHQVIHFASILTGGLKKACSNQCNTKCKHTWEPGTKAVPTIR